MKQLTLLLSAALLATPAGAGPAGSAGTNFAVGPQYDSTHVYVAPEDVDRFVASFTATLGGTAGRKGEVQVTLASSQTISQLAMTPAGIVSVFGFKTPIPYPFGAERTGYLVTDIDAHVVAARKAGAIRLVETYPDPIGRDAVVQWPGGVNMQFYWHTAKPNYAPLATVPETRVYLTADAVSRFIKSWIAFSRARVVFDAKVAPDDKAGGAGPAGRLIRLSSGYGDMAVFVTSGALPWPYGRDVTGYAVADLAATLTKANAAGVETLVPPHLEGDRLSAMVRFPGGYIAEIHSARRRDPAPALIGRP